MTSKKKPQTKTKRSWYQRITHAVRPIAPHDEASSYLRKLVFDPSMLSTFRAKYLTNIRLVALAIIIIWVAGIYSFMTLPRRLNPEVAIPIVSVVAVLPGASPEDIESLLTIPLEDAIESVEGIDTLASRSQENVSSIVVQFQSSVDPEKAKDDVQNAVDTVTDLPQDAQDPQVIGLDFENQPVLQIALTTDTDLATLTQFADRLKDRLEDSPAINTVSVNGLQEREIQIVVEPHKAASYGINPLTLQQSIRSALSSFPAGTITTQNSSFSLTIDKAIREVPDIRDTVLNLDGTIVTIGDVATVTEREKPGQTKSYLARAERGVRQSVTFSIFKKKSVNINDAVAEAKRVIDEEIKPYHGQFQATEFLNLGEDIDEQFGDLTKNFRDTIILVFILLFLFLGLRQAFIASLTIPLTFLVSFTVMKFTGLSLNFLSMFSLLLALGLLVDDTIVVVTAMTAYYRTGKFTPTQTGLLVWHDFITPIWTTTISTVWAFLPLLLATGIIGEFITTIPIVVSATLYASTAISVLITLPLMMIILQPKVAWRVKVLFAVLLLATIVAVFGLLVRDNPLFPLLIVLFIVAVLLTYHLRQHLVTRSEAFLGRYIDTAKAKQRSIDLMNHGLVEIPKIAIRYRRVLDRILVSRANRWRTIALVILFAVFAYALVPLGFVVNEFFPRADANLVYVTLELPQGTNAQTANQATITLMESLQKEPGVRYVTAEVGRGLDDFGGSMGGGVNNILYTITLHDEGEKKASSIELAELLRRKYRDHATGRMQIQELSGGPPAGADVQIELLGDDLATLDHHADQLVAFLEDQQGLTNVNKSSKPGVSKLVFTPDAAQMASNSISREQLAGVLRTYASGFTIDELTRGTKTNDITFRFGTGSQTPENITSLAVPTPQGSVPLSQLGKLSLQPNPTLITRESGKRTITITAATRPGYSVSQANQQLIQKAESLQLPEGYRWQTGGVNEENQESVNSIFMAMALSAILILTTMVMQFSSFRKALIVMMAIPLAIAGVFIVFAITGTPLSFPALIGALALFGIVITVSMVLVDKINRNVQFGLPIREAITDAAASRLEPIMLGSLATIMGLIPITLTDPLWRGLGGAIIAGLLFAGAITLFFIPVVYYMWFGNHTKQQAI